MVAQELVSAEHKCTLSQKLKRREQPANDSASPIAPNTEISRAKRALSPTEQLLGKAQAQVDAVIAECLRFAPVAPMLFRLCEHDTELGGQTVKQGTLVCLLLKTAMFDPQAFPNPEEFIPNSSERPANRYLTFGFGPHRCRGQDIAQTVLRIVLKQLLLLKALRRAAGPAGRIQSMVGLPLPDSMVVRFTP
jgi:cytochrome P450